jgi:hypothetical protein
VFVTADTYPMPFTEVTAELVHPSGPSLTAKEFLMSAFISSFKDSEKCITAESARRIVQAAVDIDFPGFMVNDGNVDDLNLDPFDKWLEQFGLRDHSSAMRSAMADLNPDNLLTSLQAMSPEDVNRLISTDTLQLSEVAKDQLRGAISVLQLSATGCSVMDCGACADAAECDSVHLFWLLFSDLLFLIVALTATLVLSAASESFRKFEHANRRRICFYKYTRDAFRQNGISTERATMGNKVQKMMVQNALQISRDQIVEVDANLVLINETIAELDNLKGKAMDGDERSRYENAVVSRRDAMHTRGLCMEIVSRIELHSASNGLEAVLSQRARAALPQILARSQETLNDAQQALHREDLTTEGTKVISRYFEETAALTQLNGLPPFLFDLAHQGKAVAIFVRAKDGALRQASICSILPLMQISSTLKFATESLGCSHARSLCVCMGARVPFLCRYSDFDMTRFDQWFLRRCRATRTN